MQLEAKASFFGFGTKKKVEGSSGGTGVYGLGLSFLNLFFKALMVGKGMFTSVGKSTKAQIKNKNKKEAPYSHFEYLQ